jgi:hypothetical protein
MSLFIYKFRKYNVIFLVNLLETYQNISLLLFTKGSSKLFGSTILSVKYKAIVVFFSALSISSLDLQFSLFSELLYSHPLILMRINENLSAVKSPSMYMSSF